MITVILFFGGLAFASASGFKSQTKAINGILGYLSMATAAFRVFAEGLNGKAESPTQNFLVLLFGVAMLFLATFFWSQQKRLEAEEAAARSQWDTPNYRRALAAAQADIRQNQ